MSGFNDELQAPELDQPVLELQAGQQAASAQQQQGAGVGAIIPITAGGTGASTAAAARANLGAAPSNATYITQTANTELSAEQNLAALATGYMKSTTVTGVVTTQTVPIPAIDLSAEGRLATVTLDLNTNTKQTLYTPTGSQIATITKVTARTASVDLSGGVTTNLNFGVNAGATDWSTVAPMTINDLTTSGMFKVLDQFNAAGGGHSIVAVAAHPFGAITDAAFGSAATVVIEVFGNIF